MYIDHIAHSQSLNALRRMTALNDAAAFPYNHHPFTSYWKTKSTPSARDKETEARSESTQLSISMSLADSRSRRTPFHFPPIFPVTRYCPQRRPPGRRCGALGVITTSMHRVTRSKSPLDRFQGCHLVSAEQKNVDLDPLYPISCLLGIGVQLTRDPLYLWAFQSS